MLKISRLKDGMKLPFPVVEWRHRHPLHLLVKENESVRPLVLRLSRLRQHSKRLSQFPVIRIIWNASPSPCESGIWILGAHDGRNSHLSEELEAPVVLMAFPAPEGV